jgi:uncharacterized repeat protein (TIGR01451 family)
MRLARLVIPVLLAGSMVLVSQGSAYAAKPGRAPSADLAVTAGEPQTVRVGDDVTVTFTVTNTGPATSSADRLVADLGAQYVSASSTYGCELSYGQVLCYLGDLAANEQTTVYIRMTATSVGTFSTSATVHSEVTPDPSSANDSTSVTTTVTDHPRVATRTALPVVVSRPCTLCGFFPYETVTVSMEVVAMDGSLISEGYLSGGGCTAAVVDGHAGCTYNTTRAPGTALSGASYSGTFTYAASNSSQTV